MSDKTAMLAFVEKAKPMFADAETAIHDAITATNELVPLMREGHDALQPMVKTGLEPGGYLQSSRMACELRAASGLLSQALAVIFRIHREGTDIARHFKCDPAETDRDGGGHR